MVDKHDDVRRVDLIRAPALLMLLTAAWAVASQYPRAELPPLDSDALYADQLRKNVDPNHAPWWELTILPRIGEVTARSIVAHRESNESGGANVVFTCPEDLEAVPRIGPKTVERIRPWLRFEK